MDPPPPLPPNNILPSNTSPTTAYLAATATDSSGSSPRSRQIVTDTWDESLPQVPGAKLRVMCSYGGHIIPRPHDKSLCYMGGDTRMVIIDRQSSLSSFCARISQSLLNGRHFTLKYQLPHEELDSLISVTTDEDLENMVEEYDRVTSSSPLKPARLRLFLFLAKPETAASMGNLLNDAKSETWFVDALNGSGLLPRGLSDSAVENCLVELDDGVVVRSESYTNLDENNKQVKSNTQDLQAVMPDSPLVETGSSFGSSSSTPSMSNLPPTKVRVDDAGTKLQNQMAGIDEQFSKIDISTTYTIKHDDGSNIPSSIPPMISTLNAPTVVYNNEHWNNRLVSDDERSSDQGVPLAGSRKPPLPLQTVQRKLVDNNLPSPDSIASDSSMASANSLSKQGDYHEPTQVPQPESRVPVVAPVTNPQDLNSHTQVHQIYDPTYQQQQQFIHQGVQYIHHHPTTGQAQVSSYYPIYPPPQQQHHQIDQQNYPIYVLPVSTQNQVPQQYSYPNIQPNLVDPTVVANRPEMAGNNIYRTTNNNYPQHFTGVPQMLHPSQSVQANNNATNYGYEYLAPTNEQLYYAQHTVVGQMPAQHQTMNAVMMTQATENSAQQIRTSDKLEWER